MRGTTWTTLLEPMRACALGTMVAVCGLPVAAAAQPASNDDNGQVDLAAGQTRFELEVGQSRVIRTPWPAARVSVTDPEVADVNVVAPDQVLVLGKRVGSTDLLVWSAAEELLQVRVDVFADTGRLQRELDRLFPGAELDVVQAQGVLVVRGQLRTVEDAKQLKSFLTASGANVLDMTTVPGGQQVQIKVRVAEVSRNAIRTLGVNFLYIDDDFVFANLVSPSSGGSLVTPDFTTGTSTFSPAVSVFSQFPNSDLTFLLQALAENQYLRILAEPSLMCLSGEEASLLAGGEFPIPIVQSADVESISIEYKEFGIRLRFTPTVLGENQMRIKVASEVSELSDVGAVVIQGFRIPSLQTRRAETTLELRSGQSFALAGLLSRKVDARNSRIPLLGDLPVLGTLFRSVRYASGETELVILCTASFVEPLDLASDPALPGDAHITPNDWELYIDGRLEGAVPPLSRADAAWLREKGLVDLRGPGAWVGYGQPPALSQAIDRRQLDVPPPAEEPADGPADTQ